MNITTKYNLITKAGHNHLTGEWAEKQGYFDVAVSRYYYALFQKSLFIILKPPSLFCAQLFSHISFML
jgi:hypothetical protein